MNFEKLTSESGMPIYYYKMPFIKSVTMGILVKVGTRDEIWPEEAGIAHALEHMVFRGTEDFSTGKELSAYIEDVGGQINAWTDEEMTFFWNKLPFDKLERGIHCLSQMMRKSLFRQGDVQQEMKAVIQETKRANDDPEQYLWIKAEEIIYNGHPLGRNILGIEESVNSFNSANFIHFVRKFYHPANLRFIIVGNFNIEQVRDLIEKYFPEKAIESSNQRKKIKAKLPKEKLFVETRQIEQCHLMISTSVCKYKSPDIWPLSLFRTMISGGMSSPLFQEVREKRGLAYEVWANCNFKSDIGDFIIYIGTDRKDKDEAIKVALKVMEESKTVKLLKKAKEMSMGKLALLYENPSSILRAATREIGTADKIISFEEKTQKINEVTIDQIEEVCEKYLLEERLITVMLMPGK